MIYRRKMPIRVGESVRVGIAPWLEWMGCRRNVPERPSSWPSRGRGAREILDALSALPPKPLPHY
eukprot:COSAG02_NODE_28042_length_597_cov_1.297189_1_plen_64_part_01